jgi:hypothetical protein
METAITCETLLLILPIHKMQGNAVGPATRLRAARFCIRTPIGARVFFSSPLCSGDKVAGGEVIHLPRSSVEVKS